MCFIKQFFVIVLATIVIMFVYEYVYKYLLFVSPITAVESTALTLLLDVLIKPWLGH